MSMPKFAANLSMLFTELAFLDRFKAAADAGFQGVEYLFPYEYEAAEIGEQLRVNGLQQVLFNMPPGDWDKGDRGLACLPECRDQFEHGLKDVITYAKVLGCRHVHCMAGIVSPERGRSAEFRETYIANLKTAAKALAREDLQLLIEPINTRDMPGYFLTGTRQAISIIDEVAAPNINLQYDVYHMQIMEGDVVETVTRTLPRIAHIQIAGVPGRNEPDGSSEINFPHIFGTLDRLGYDGWVGCEYRPRGTTLDGLGWFAPYRAGSAQ
jgi:hydroxypyruvate isomerase